MYNPQMEGLAPARVSMQRHGAVVRVTHWISVLAFAALLLTGVEILTSHPRFYWGETGNVGTKPIFRLPIPSSRDTVPTGYGYVLPDQNGWSRYLHFQAAWVTVLTGLFYVTWGLTAGHVRRNLLPNRGSLTWSMIAVRRHALEDAASYNPAQRLVYLAVIFVLFPMVVWTGLAMSPGFVSAVPAAVTVLGGQQSARTLHLFVSVALVLFLAVHLGMLILTGFGSRVRAMITGAPQPAWRMRD